MVWLFIFSSLGAVVALVGSAFLPIFNWAPAIIVLAVLLTVIGRLYWQDRREKTRGRRYLREWH